MYPGPAVYLYPVIGVFFLVKHLPIIQQIPQPSWA